MLVCDSLSVGPTARKSSPYYSPISPLKVEVREKQVRVALIMFVDTIERLT